MLFADTSKYPLFKVPTPIRKSADEMPTKQEIFWSWTKRAGKFYNYSYTPSQDTWTNIKIEMPVYAKKPFEKNNYIYKKHKNYKIGWGKIISYLFKFGILIFFLKIFSEAENNDTVLWIPFGWWILVVILILINVLIFKDDLCEVQHSEELISTQKNENELREESNRVINEKNEFERTYKIFTEQTETDKKYVSSCLIEEREILSREKYADALKAKLKPERNPKPVVRGKLELDFLKVLYNKFKGQILCDQRVRVRNEYFYPDFVLYDYYNEMLIDIEIDEPYSLLNKQPIHYQNSGDSSRDKYFLQNNWAVIRFTEKQIAKYPIECARLIYDFKRAIENKEPNLKITIPEESVWSYEQALLWSKENYRDTYHVNS